ncbi:MAG: 4,5-DOPA dioxygenase extradiol [Ignavibacteriaceae bacterium]|nr:4,5-DOPA dioxygenase extradiol [Ignavibacteriaceae bacterium]
MSSDQLSGINSNFPETEQMPLLFLGHGSPMNAIEENEFVRGWRVTGEKIPKPAAVLCISAHWETNGTLVTAMEKPRTIHDFGGFPHALFEVQYPAPGNPDLAKSLSDGVKNTEVKEDLLWGLDHGCWSVVKHLYPNADVPVLQLSLDYRKSPRDHYELAKELSSLRKRGVLILGSGNLIHNLRLIEWRRLSEPDYTFDWAESAKEKLQNLIKNDDHNSLINYDSLGTDVKLSIPTPEHYLPSLYILALKGESESISFFNDKTVGGSVAMTSFKIE